MSGLVEKGSRLQTSIAAGKEAGKVALFFGCWDRPGHFLHDANGRHLWESSGLNLPWNASLMDAGLLRNGRREDKPDGRVFWTCGGRTFCYAFYWWDRSLDQRAGSNSGFYVRGFGWPEALEAFDYACQTFPQIVARQKWPLTLQSPHPRHVPDGLANLGGGA